MLKRLTPRERRIFLAVLAALLVGALVQWVRGRPLSEPVGSEASAAVGSFFLRKDSVLRASGEGADSFT